MIKSLRDKYYSKALLFSGGIFLICAVLCLGYIYKFKQAMKVEIVGTCEANCAVGGKIIAERFATDRNLVKQSAGRIEKLSKLPDEEIYGILAECEQSENFDQVFYFGVNGQMIHSNGQETMIENGLEDMKLEENDYSNGPVVAAHMDADMNTSSILIISPVYKEEQTIGYVIGETATENAELVSVDDFYQVDPVFYIVQEDGRIVSKYAELGNEITEIVGVKNLCSAFEEMDSIYFNQKSDIDKWRTDLEKQKEGSISIPFREGLYHFVYVPIDTQTGWSLITVVSDDTVVGIVQDQITSTILICVFILLLVLLLVVYISTTAIQSGKKIESIAYSDELTCAKNMNYFKKRAMELIQSEKRLPYVLVCYDISGFRYINEAFGHERGNEILRMLAEYGQESFGSKEVFARNTADQFVALMADLGDISARMDSFTQRINEYARNIDVSFPIFLRAGYYRVKKADTDISSMIDKADIARRTISRDSKIWTVSYSGQMQRELKIREEIESSMEQALVHNEFEVYLQPKFDLFRNEVAGAEALVRWVKADGTMVYPDQFIPIFEQNGFVEKLDFFMLESICKMIHKLIGEGKKVVPISVNQSRVLLMSLDYVKKVQYILKKYEVPKDAIELELTETVFFDDRDRMISVMNELKSSDILWDIDDFGTGFSSLNLLKDVPFDCLKIDRGFFSETTNSETSKLILRKIVEMAEGIHVQCICEGVETEEQAQFLRSIGCRYAQGFLYSKPIPLGEFIERYVTE